jgi:integrase/recombinase XerD
MTTRRQPLTPLRQRLWEDLQLRNSSAPTRRASLHWGAAFAKQFGPSPEPLGPAQVRLYHLLLSQAKQRAWPTVVPAVCARRLFSRGTRKRPGMLEDIAPPHRPVTLPPILSHAAGAAVLTALPHLKHRAICTTLSAAGWRVAALCQVQVTASDSARMVLRVRQGQGQQARAVRLAPTLLPW